MCVCVHVCVCVCCVTCACVHVCVCACVVCVWVCVCANERAYMSERKSFQSVLEQTDLMASFMMYASFNMQETGQEGGTALVLTSSWQSLLTITKPL